MARYADGTHQRAAQCRQCGARRIDGARTSKRGLCVPCAKKNVREALRQEKRKSGPIYRRSLEAQIARAQRELEAMAE